MKKKSAIKKKSCYYCKRPFSQAYLEERREKRSKSIKKALKKMKAEGRSIGRKRGSNYEKIYPLMRKGKSIREIAETLKLSRGTVQHAIKLVRKGLK